jgi:hypothetical protein
LISVNRSDSHSPLDALKLPVDTSIQVVAPTTAGVPGRSLRKSRASD